MVENKKKIAILCSGVTLGIYIPAIVLYKQLKSLNIDVEVFVLEEFFLTDKKEKLLDTKKAFHNNFKFALMGQKFTTGIDQSINMSAIDSTLEYWKNKGFNKFLVFSGYWGNIMDLYLEQHQDNAIEIQICHMDVTSSASWKKFRSTHLVYKHNWMFSIEDKSVTSYIDISGEIPIPFHKRKDNIIIHGGGWGIGTYKEMLPVLSEKKDIQLDIIAYDLADINGYNNNFNFYLLDPEWKAWEKNSKNEYTFPPLLKINNGISDSKKISNPKFSEVYNIIKKNKAIISKPGGATLIDSLAAATPIIFLDPFGDYEKKNAELWEYFGFGISFIEWQKSNYSFKLLESMHNNILLKRKELINYIETI